jgi:hypothetical protein
MLDVHGLLFDVRGWPEVAAEVMRDFLWFEAGADPGGRSPITVELAEGRPEWDGYGDLDAAFITPRNVVYQNGDRTILDYFGRAVAVLDRAAGTIVIRGENPHLVHEAAYLFLLSRIGEHLDAIGLPRLHALGLAGPRGAICVLLPSGGGKSTLAVSALADRRVRILAEDTPLLDTRGFVHPFPLRIGVNPGDADRLPPGSVRRIERMEFHDKLVLDLDGFRDRVEADPQPMVDLVVGRRSLAGHGKLERLPRRAAAGALLREGVVGIGVYQGMEFVLQRGMRDIASKAGEAAMRARCCVAAARRARVWRLTLGRDHASNWEALSQLLDA